jgi:hypothetical protein
MVGGVLVCAAVLAFSRSARRHVAAGWATFRDAETRRAERALVLLGVLLIVSGGVIPGPLDELLGIALIGHVSRRVARRKAAGLL